MQIINKIVNNESTDLTHFFWVHYIPNWISPIWFYLIIWYLIIFLTINWKNNSIKIKISLKDIKWEENLYFLTFSIILYSSIILYQYNTIEYVIIVTDLLLGYFLDNLELYVNHLLEKENEDPLEFLHDLNVFRKEIFTYLKK